MRKSANGEPDTLRGVSPVRRGDCTNLPQGCGKAVFSYPTCVQIGPFQLREFRCPLPIITGKSTCLTERRKLIREQSTAGKRQVIQRLKGTTEPQ